GVDKIGLLEFTPEVLAGDVIVPRPSRAGGDVKLLLPLQFTNSGSADGIIEWVALRLTLDGDIQRSVLLSPVAEVDMQRFIQSKRRLDGENTIDLFTAFPLEGKRSLAKFVLFDLAEKGRSEPLRLRSGRWCFEVFVKSSANRSPTLERSFLGQRGQDDEVGQVDHQASRGCGGLRRRLELHHQAFLAARHREVALGEQARIEQRAVQGAVGVVDEVALAQRVERVFPAG